MDDSSKKDLAVGARIKAQRLALGMSQTELANALGFSDPSTVKNYEKGRVPKGDVLGRLAAVFKISADWLLTGATKNPSVLEAPGRYELTRGNEGLHRQLDAILKCGNAHVIAIITEQLDKSFLLARVLSTGNQAFEVLWAAATAKDEDDVLKHSVKNTAKK